jgi:D-beta-D-heptose 7-phosphate kinase/D-beta-D-heptose 1-phosphate adenosyltransferase
MKVIAVSGYFDPIHVGHLEYLKMAKNLGDKLIVIINSDYQAGLKKGKSFMSEDDRLEIIKSLRCVDEVFLSIDKDKSVCKSLEYLKPDIFANGGNRSLNEIPETTVMKKYNIEMIDGLGMKIRSSSQITGIK